MYSKYKHNYSVVGLHESDAPNVLSLEQRTSRGNLIRFDDTGNQYRVLWVDEPLPTESGAACLAIDNRVTLRVALDKW